MTNILGVMRIKNEERWIRQSIESQLPVCRQVLVLDDHSTDSTRSIVESFGDRCMLIESPFEGVNEARDKTYLLQQVFLLRPDWVLWIDGDEELEKKSAHILLEEASNDAAAWFTMPILYFWNSVNTYRTDGCYGSFHRRSFFRMKGQIPSNVRFQAGTGDAGLHGGGNCPDGLEGIGYTSRVRVKHFGYLDAAERQRKYEWYNKIDPNNQDEDCYRHIMATERQRQLNGAVTAAILEAEHRPTVEAWSRVHAPGPTVLQEWND